MWRSGGGAACHAGKRYLGRDLDAADPATSPPAMSGMSMASDAPTGTVVLFGGGTSQGKVTETWTWNGTTWTNQNEPLPFATKGVGMAYDAATGTAVLFGGQLGKSLLDDTWTWG